MRNISVRSKNFACNSFGKAYFQFLIAIHKTPKEFGTLDTDEQFFLIHAYNEWVKEMNKSGS